MSGPTPSVLEVRDLVCQRGSAALRTAHAQFSPGRLHLLRGDADSGNDLLLRVLGLLEAPDAGAVLLAGAPVQALPDKERLKLREQRLGFIFTAPFLLPAFSVIENVAMPLFKVSAVDPAEARARSEMLLEFVGLLDAAPTPGGLLAPADQHRVALARALVNQPAALLVERLAADAPEDFPALLRLAAERFAVAVIASVAPEFPAAAGDQVIELRDGRADTTQSLSPDPIA